MRRGNLNRISLILILIAGIFSLSSFVLDQMVVQTEDKIRQKELEYKQSLFNLSNYSAINSNLQYLAQITESKFRSLERRNEILKVMLTNLLDKEYFEDIYSDYKDLTNAQQIEEFKERTKIIYKREYVFLSNDFIQEISSIKKILKYIKFNDKDLQIIFDKIQNEAKLNDFNDQNINTTFDNYESVYNSYEEINKTYFNLIDQADKLRKVYETISTLKGETSERWMNSGVKMKNIEKELSKIENLENNYILFSILCQILGLVSLLILFRVLLIN